MAYADLIANVTQKGANAFHAFTGFVNAVAEDKPYRQFYTEGKGALNLVFGALELLTAGVFKATSCCSQMSREQAPRHVAMGTRTLKQGWKEIDLKGKATAIGNCAYSLYERCHVVYESRVVVRRGEASISMALRCPPREQQDDAARAQPPAPIAPRPATVPIPGTEPGTALRASFTGPNGQLTLAPQSESKKGK